MSGRPGEWHLLGHDADPVPGDVGEVYAEASHYRSIAATITDQIAELRRLAQPDAALKGHYAEALQDGMRELADDLAKAENRFTVVASQLTRLAPELSDARRTTASALAASPVTGVCTSPAISRGSMVSPCGQASWGSRSAPGGPDAIQPPPSRVAIAGIGLRTTLSAKAAAGAGVNCR